MRYLLEDRVRVTGQLEWTPCLEFLGRLGGTDLVGEKLDATAISQLLSDLGRAHGVHCVTLFAVEGPAPGYCLVAEGPGALKSLVERDLEGGLGCHHHYQLARELGQLEPARVLLLPDATALLLRRAEHLGLSAGEAKGGSLQVWGLVTPPEPFAGVMEGR